MARIKHDAAKPAVHQELEGFEISINEFGEIISSKTVDDLNQFLNKKVNDKKLQPVVAFDDDDDFDDDFDDEDDFGDDFDDEEFDDEDLKEFNIDKETFDDKEFDEDDADFEDDFEDEDWEDDFDGDDDY